MLEPRYGPQRGLWVPKEVSLVCNDYDSSFAWCRPTIAHIDWDTRPVISRVIDNSKVTDLAPLRGLPIEELRCEFLEISDLTPLAGMPASTLKLYATQVKGMPLTQVHIHARRITDLSPLRGIRLTFVTLDPGRITKGLDVIRAMPSITKIGTNSKVGIPPR